MPDAAAQAAGLIRLADGVYCTSPTRRHVILVQVEGETWITWEGFYHSSNGGRSPMRELVRYRGRDFKRALAAATRFAGRFER